MTVFGALLVAFSEARSRGLYLVSEIYGCDMMTTRYGCYTGWTPDPEKGFRRWCNDSNFANKGMWWTGYPKVSLDHTLRTADGIPSGDPTSYTPNSLMRLFVRTNKPRLNYKGILLYAVDGNETKVGDWELQPEQRPYYSVSSTPGHICKGALSHSYSTPRGYLEVYYFRTPPKGTGTIKFRCMFKVGPPNPTFDGDFLYPRENLTLNEGPSSTGWVVLPPGESCSSYCNKQKAHPCTDKSLLVYTPQYALASKPITACSIGYNADCSGDSPGDKGGYCFYRNATCGPNYVNNAPVPSCGTVSPKNGVNLFCVCGQPPAPTVPPKTSGVTRPLVSTLSLLTAGLFSIALNLKQAPIVLLIAVVAIFGGIPANAHNYVEGTLGRAPYANLIYPTFPLMDNRIIQVQANPGQRFRVEWANAHTDWTYLVVLHTANESKLELHDPDLLDDYLSSCPGGNMTKALANGQDPRHKKYHIAPANINLDYSGPNCGTGSKANNVVLNNFIDPASPNKFPRRPNNNIFPNQVCVGYGDGLFSPGTNGWVDGSLCDQPAQIEFKPLATTDDAMCEYYNPAYPWIESVRKFLHVDYRCHMDSAWINIPARDGPGRYQIHYVWSSYRDSIDVDIQPQTKPVPDELVFGNATDAESVYGVADHCVFENATGGWTNPPMLGQCVGVVTTAEHCKVLCERQWFCNAFAVVPVSGPEPFPNETPIPWDTTFCPKSLFANVPKNSLVCYTVNGFRDDMNGAVAPWTIYSDPRDIGFYSTCYVKQRAKRFKYTPNPPVVPDMFPYRFSDKCLPCRDRMLKSTVEHPIDWHVTDCTDCDKYPELTPRRPPAIPDWTLLAKGFFNHTPPSGCPGCVKWLAPPGSSYAMEDECRVLAVRDPECGPYVAFSNKRVVHQAEWFLWKPLNYTSDLQNLERVSCACWRKKACCGADPAYNDNWDNLVGNWLNYSVFNMSA